MKKVIFAFLLPVLVHFGDLQSYEPCTDKYTECKTWKMQNMCTMSNYKQYMISTCPDSCDLCTKYPEPLKSISQNLTDQNSTVISQPQEPLAYGDGFNGTVQNDKGKKELEAQYLPKEPPTEVTTIPQAMRLIQSLSQMISHSTSRKNLRAQTNFERNKIRSHERGKKKNVLQSEEANEDVPIPISKRAKFDNNDLLDELKSNQKTLEMLIKNKKRSAINQHEKNKHSTHNKSIKNTTSLRKQQIKKPKYLSMPLPPLTVQTTEMLNPPPPPITQKKPYTRPSKKPKYPGMVLPPLTVTTTEMPKPPQPPANQELPYDEISEQSNYTTMLLEPLTVTTTEMLHPPQPPITPEPPETTPCTTITSTTTEQSKQNGQQIIKSRTKRLTKLQVAPKAKVKKQSKMESTNVDDNQTEPTNTSTNQSEPISESVNQSEPVLKATNEDEPTTALVNQIETTAATIGQSEPSTIQVTSPPSTSNEESEPSSESTPTRYSMILRQTFESDYEDTSSSNYSILKGNVVQDLNYALGSDSVIGEVEFEMVNGKSSSTSCTKVTFTVSGDLSNISKLEDLVDSGSINGLRVQPNSFHKE